MKIICKYCKNYFDIYPSNRKVFCSKICKNKYKACKKMVCGIQCNPIAKEKIKCDFCLNIAMSFSMGKSYCKQCSINMVDKGGYKINGN